MYNSLTKKFEPDGRKCPGYDPEHVGMETMLVVMIDRSGQMSERGTELALLSKHRKIPVFFKNSDNLRLASNYYPLPAC